jgi:hypothetical protein
MFPERFPCPPNTHATQGGSKSGKGDPVRPVLDPAMKSRNRCLCTTGSVEGRSSEHVEAPIIGRGSMLNRLDLSARPRNQPIA